jgi:hypothetical protein
MIALVKIHINAFTDALDCFSKNKTDNNLIGYNEVDSPILLFAGNDIAHMNACLGKLLPNTYGTLWLSNRIMEHGYALVKTKEEYDEFIIDLSWNGFKAASFLIIEKEIRIMNRTKKLESLL